MKRKHKETICGIINSLVLAAITVHESGWGSSRLAQDKNNLARLLAGRPGTLADVGRWYAADPGWAAKVAGCMKYIVKRSGENGR